VLRSLYLSLLWSHPRAFRERFAEEMLWIFDETPSRNGKAFLLRDGFHSVARQWVMRSGMWKLAVAVVLAFIQAAIFLHPYD
jgi:hypothetical protein